MKFPFGTRAVSRRGVLAFALLVSAVSIAARPAAPGVTYTVRMVATPPEIPNMAPQPQTVVVGRGYSIGSLSRLDIDTATGNAGLTVGDYMLSLDSGRMVVVSPATRTYTEGMPGMNALPPDVLASASITNVSVTTEKLGAGEMMQGYATEKVRMTITYSMAIMGTALNTMTVAEMWVAQLPGQVTTAFDGAIPKEMADGPMKELAEKSNEARKALGAGTPLKTVTTSSISGPINVTTSTTLELLNVKTVDVDPAMLKVPEGFVKK